MIEPSRTDKHAAQWISSLENHVPPEIWNKPAEQIEPPDLLQALQDIEPHERARNFRVVRTNRPPRPGAPARRSRRHSRAVGLRP